MNKELVVIEKVDEHSVGYGSLGASKENFPNAKVGQEWEVVTEETDPKWPNAVFPLGVIVSTRLITDVKE